MHAYLHVYSCKYGHACCVCVSKSPVIIASVDWDNAPRTERWTWILVAHQGSGKLNASPGLDSDAESWFGHVKIQGLEAYHLGTWWSPRKPRDPNFSHGDPGCRSAISMAPWGAAAACCAARKVHGTQGTLAKSQLTVLLWSTCWFQMFLIFNHNTWEWWLLIDE